MRRCRIINLFVFICVLSVMIIAACSSEDNPTDPEGGGGPSGPAIWFVDHDAMGAGDGTSWDDAFIHPSDAMTAASSGDQIWVAYGTYYGPGGKSDPVVAFKAGVFLYGGFGGTETDLSQRDPADRATFDGGDTLYHIVTGADDALLHGIHVTNGNANNMAVVADMNGGGIYCYNDKMRISNCVIDYNRAGSGGGVFAQNDTVLIDSCSVSNNEAYDSERDWTGGGGITILTGDAVIAYCSIANNNSARDGGGLLLHNSVATVNYCDISSNTLDGPYSNGGGMHITNHSSTALISEFYQCRFAGNTGGYGGAVSLFSSSPHFDDCELEDNNASMTGAAIYAANSSYLIEHSIIDDNNSTAIYIFGPLGATDPRIFNCVLSRNGETDNHGGAIMNNAVDTEIECCTIVYNIAGNGGGIYSSGTCSPVVNNCILWFNTATTGEAQIHEAGGATTQVTYTDIDQAGYDAGTGNLRNDPLFVVGPRGDFYLSHTAAGQGSDSPCIDIGSDTAVAYSLHLLTTRTDSVVDADQVDLGFHYEPDN